MKLASVSIENATKGSQEDTAGVSVSAFCEMPALGE